MPVAVSAQGTCNVRHNNDNNGDEVDEVDDDVPGSEERRERVPLTQSAHSSDDGDATHLSVESDTESSIDGSSAPNGVNGSFSSAPIRTQKIRFLLIAVVMMNDSFAATMIMPITALLIVRFFPQYSRSEAGRLSGVLISLYNVAQAVCARRWGRFSDQHGRRPALAIGLIASTFASVLFGLAPNFYVCAIARLLHGMANGNAPVAKAMVAELTTKDTEALGFSYTSMGLALGGIVGPATGGLLYSPADRFEFFRGTIFDDRPALLASVVLSLYSALVTYIIVCVLPESNRKATPVSWLPSWLNPPSSLTATSMAGSVDDEGYSDESRDRGEADGTTAATDLEKQRILQRHAIDRSNDSSDADNVPMVQKKKDIARPGDASSRNGQENTESNNDRGDENNDGSRSSEDQASTQAAKKTLGFRELFADPLLRKMSFIASAASIVNMLFLELFPLLAIIAPSLRGFGMDAPALGVLQAATSVCAIILNVFYKRIDALLGRRMILMLCFTLWAVSLMAVPTIARFLIAAETETGSAPLHENTSSSRGHHHSNGQSTASSSSSSWLEPFKMAPHSAVLFFVLWVVTAFRRVAASAAFSTSAMCLGAMSPKEHVGSVMSLTYSIGNVMRAVIPPLVTALFAWSVTATPMSDVAVSSSRPSAISALVDPSSSPSPSTPTAVSNASIQASAAVSISAVSNAVASGQNPMGVSAPPAASHWMLFFQEHSTAVFRTVASEEEAEGPITNTRMMKTTPLTEAVNSTKRASPSEAAVRYTFHPFPFDVYLTWIITAVVCGAAVWTVRSMRQEDMMRKE